MSSWPLHAEIFLLLCRHFTTSYNQGLAALLVLKMVGKGTRTLLDVDVDVVDEVDVLPLSLPPQTGDRDCDDGAPLPLRLAGLKRFTW